jgi:pimeloyl-ACP methyl ester carboxylesterase
VLLAVEEKNDMVIPDHTADVASFDGTRIAYQVFGEGPVLIVGNGIGVGYEGLKLQIDHLRDRFQLVCWDHRGIFASAPPGRGGVGVEAHAKDCLAVMGALGIDQAAGYIGWSMGAQVGFEVIRQERNRFGRMALIGGIAGSPFRAAFRLPAVDRVLSRAVGSAARVAPLLSPFTRRVVGRDSFYHFARLAKYVQPTVDREVFLTMARGVAGHSPRLYLRTLAELGRHDASAIVPELSIPLLFLAGGKDYMMPRRALDRIASSARDARVHTIEEGSHFALLEAPARINRLLDDFFASATRS